MNHVEESHTTIHAPAEELDLRSIGLLATANEAVTLVDALRRVNGVNLHMAVRSEAL